MIPHTSQGMYVWTLHTTREITRSSLSPGGRRKRGGETDIYQELDRSSVCEDIYHLIYCVMNVWILQTTQTIHNHDNRDRWNQNHRVRETVWPVPVVETQRSWEKVWLPSDNTVVCLTHTEETERQRGSWYPMDPPAPLTLTTHL